MYSSGAALSSPFWAAPPASPLWMVPPRTKIMPWRRFALALGPLREARKLGSFKTPDALLPVPLMVHGRPVHWIDSKATFGDPTSHATYMAEQFSAYLNRFDAGLVIYWFGYDQSISHEDPKLIVADDLLASECELATCLPTAALQAAAPLARDSG